MAGTNSDSNYRTPCRSSACPSILVGDCATNCSWASHFERLILDAKDLKSKIRMVSGSSECIDNESAGNPAVLVLTTASIDRTRGVTALRELRKCHFQHPILVLTDTQNEQALMQLMDEGACDF